MVWLVLLFILLAVLSGLVISFMAAFVLIAIDSAKGDFDEYDR